jgi:hypothetical protein
MHDASCPFNALLIAGPGGTRPDLLALPLGCPCRQAARHVEEEVNVYNMKSSGLHSTHTCTNMFSLDDGMAWLCHLLSGKA